jgi:hypothetical protein
MGRGGMGNGQLMDAAERSEFDLFIVADKNLRYQQNLLARKIAILELWTNHRPTLENHFSDIRAATERIKPGEYLILDKPL